MSSRCSSSEVHYSISKKKLTLKKWQRFIIVLLLKTDEAFWLKALNKIKLKAKKWHKVFQSKRLQFRKL